MPTSTNSLLNPLTCNGQSSKPKSDIVFTPSHAVTYGLKVMNLCPVTAQVVSVRCQFCIYFGVEIDPTKPLRERAVKTTNMAWTHPFRADKYQSHHRSQHPSNWATYQACSVTEKAQFFTAVVTPYTNTLLVHVNSGSAAMPLKFKIRSPIVDIFIGDLFFHPNDQGGITQQNALKLFKHVNSIDRLGDHCEVIISNSEAFKMAIRNLAAGMSFRQCVYNHDNIKDVLGNTFKTCQLSNLNRYRPNWNSLRSKSCWVCKDCPCTQS